MLPRIASHGPAAHDEQFGEEVAKNVIDAHQQEIEEMLNWLNEQ